MLNEVRGAGTRFVAPTFRGQPRAGRIAPATAQVTLAQANEDRRRPDVQPLTLGRRENFDKVHRA